MVESDAADGGRQEVDEQLCAVTGKDTGVSAQVNTELYSWDSLLPKIRLQTRP
jgi:hypothetical protein